MVSRASGSPSLVSTGSRAYLPGRHARWKPNTLTFAVRQLLRATPGSANLQLSSHHLVQLPG